MKLADGNKPINVGDPSFIYKGVYNPIYWIGDKPYRPRVETLVIKNARYVYINLKDDIDKVPADQRYKRYSLPGGSLDNDSTKLQQAEAETNEEALVKVTFLYNTGYMYYELYEPGFILKGGDTPLEYYGSISDIFIGVYDGPYDKSKVDPKDLDPEMTEHGGFYEITKIAKYLRKEHIEALLSSQFVAEDVKMSLRLLRTDNVNEATSAIVIPNRYLYHGSIYKIDEFKPMSLDLGNYETEPGWSTFCFDNYDYAMVYGLMRAIQNWASDINISISPIFRRGHIIFSEKDFNTITSNTDISGKHFGYYVYTIDSEPLNVGVGNDASLREYTFRESGIKPVDTDCLNLSMYDLRSYIDVLDDAELQKDNEYSMLLTHEYNNEAKIRNKLQEAIRVGNLKPGDDVKKYMEDNGLFFKDDDINLPDLSVDIDEPVLDSIDFTPYLLMEETYPIECYGLPERKAYPMPDEKHVKSAIRFFNYAKPNEEKELAKKINEKIKEFKITDISIGEKNRFKKYYIPVNENYSLKDYLATLESLYKSVESVKSNTKKYSLYEQSRNVIRLMVSNLEAGIITESMTDDDVSSLMDVCFNALAEINQNQIELLTETYDDTRSKKFKSILESVLHPVMEADDEDDEATSISDDNEDNNDSTDTEDETATDYEAMADDADDTPDDSGDDTATDYEAMADDEGGDNADTTTDEEPDTTSDDMGDNSTGDDSTDDTSDSEDANVDNTDTSTDDSTDGTEDEATDYGAMADGMDDGDTGSGDSTDMGDDSSADDTSSDTSDDDSSAENTDENNENNNRYDNKELKNYFLLNNFLSVHETVIDVLDSVSGTILPTPEANSIMAKVVKNLQSIKTFTEKFIQFQFSDSDYAFNLYYYNIIISALRINLNLLEEAFKLGEAKTKKKSNMKEE